MNTKRLGIIIFAIMLPFMIWANEETYVVKIAPRGMNKLFAGIYNVVDISVAGVPQSDLKVAFTNAMAQKI